MNKPNTILNTTRLNYIDWLRVSAVLLLFIFHTNSIFNHRWLYYLKNPEESITAVLMNYFIYQWHMPLFMFLSGMSSYYALKFRSGRKFTLERIKRLLIPLLFGSFVLVPPLSYIRTLGDPKLTWPGGMSHLAPDPGTYQSFLAFLPDYYSTGIFPFGYLEWSHLWFLAYLLTFSLLAIKLFLFFKTERGMRIINGISAVVTKPFGIMLFAIPIALSELALRWKYPGLQNLVADWANFVTYFTVFVFGFIMVSHERFLQAIDRHWKQTLFIGVFLNLLMTVRYLLGITAGLGDVTLYMAGMTVRAIIMWSTLIGLTGLGRRYFNGEGRFLVYAREAALPYYILHMILIVVLGYPIINLPWSLAAKYFVLVAASFVCTAVIYEIGVRRINILRFCFGLK